ncbi:hypothetical protein [Limnoglobus roseus]|uniref:Phage tail protein n=1 Tax=Limnoglobus roseus TaxID=2598579 RepID=A0A5C1AL76_9BACT|nr:hypothetical protein [Limnoglobus roseus]QEL18716.1 hypothetical protein PX52LOC_05752 [Limnoglobus roseus]
MPINDFSVGKDVSLTVVTSYGTMKFAGLTDFSADPMTTDLKSKALDGTPRFGFIPDGYKGSFKLDRMDPTVDNYWAQVEADYYAGKNQKAGTISEIITEADGSITEWRYTGVILRLEKSGDWGGDKKVEQSITFEAAKKIKVA